AHSTFAWNAGPFLPERELRHRIEALLPPWSGAWPLASVLFNLPPNTSLEPLARALALGMFPLADICFPGAALGELLAASGAMTAALGCEQLRGRAQPAS